MFYCHSGLQDDRALTPAPGCHHSASRQRKGEWRIEQAVLWASPRSDVHHFHPQPVGQDPAIRPWLTSRENGKCSLAECSRGNGRRFGGLLAISSSTRNSKSIWSQVNLLPLLRQGARWPLLDTVQMRRGQMMFSLCEKKCTSSVLLWVLQFCCVDTDSTCWSIHQAGIQQGPSLSLCPLQG